MPYQSPELTRNSARADAVMIAHARQQVTPRGEPRTSVRGPRNVQIRPGDAPRRLMPPARQMSGGLAKVWQWRAPDVSPRGPSIRGRPRGGKTFSLPQWAPRRGYKTSFATPGAAVLRQRSRGEPFRHSRCAVRPISIRRIADHDRRPTALAIRGRWCDPRERWPAASPRHRAHVLLGRPEGRSYTPTTGRGTSEVIERP
jgi:hypothetical protein